LNEALAGKIFPMSKCSSTPQNGDSVAGYPHRMGSMSQPQSLRAFASRRFSGGTTGRHSVAFAGVELVR